MACAEPALAAQRTPTAAATAAAREKREKESGMWWHQVRGA
jgi:hypothetical protein